MMRNKAMQLGILFVMILALSCAVFVYAQAGSQSKGSSSKGRMDEDVIGVTVEGEQMMLDHGSGTKGSGTKGDHSYGLKVVRAVDQDGRELPELNGQVLTYRDTDKSRELIKKHRQGERLIIKGRLSVEEKMLEVESFAKRDADGSGSRGSGTKRAGSGSK
ncbi:hypothetical protein HRbin10_02324 [bacterium HR10]|nr:hypothetical protein HRbin10_02324 [bacterium HR10]